MYAGEGVMNSTLDALITYGCTSVGQLLSSVETARKWERKVQNKRVSDS
jgi:hypothetical protein